MNHIKRWAAIAVLTSISGLAAAGAAVAPVANLFADFSTTVNPNGAWTYGHAPTLGGTFTPFNQSLATFLDGAHQNIAGWKPSTAGVPVMGINTGPGLLDDGNVSLPTGEVVMHGIASGTAAEVIWTAALTGTYEIVATFTGRQYNMKANVAVFSNASSVFANSIQGVLSTSTYNGTLSLIAGDKLTFGVNRVGLDPNGFGGNWTGLAVAITPVPESGTWVLMAAGLAGLCIRMRRRTFKSRDMAVTPR